MIKYPQTILLSLVGLIACDQLLASELGARCFSGHVRESIQINKQRKDFYIQLLGKKSAPLFNRLIASEYFTLPLASFYDSRARYFHRHGMDLFCQEFVSMDATPDSTTDKMSPLEDFQQFNWRSHVKKLKVALKQNNTTEAKIIAHSAIQELEGQPHYHCFTRHMFESIYRLAYFVDIRKEEALQLGIKSPEKLLISAIKAHLESFSFAELIDRMAMPWQQQGHPILCQELPNIIQDLPPFTET
jgi:hypothetical protein